MEGAFLQRQELLPREHASRLGLCTQKVREKFAYRTVLRRWLKIEYDLVGLVTPEKLFDASMFDPPAERAATHHPSIERNRLASMFSRKHCDFA